MHSGFICFFVVSSCLLFGFYLGSIGVLCGLYFGVLVGFDVAYLRFQRGSYLGLI